MRISDWSSDVCSSDLVPPGLRHRFAVLFQQIPPVVEQAGIDKPRHGHELIVHRVVGDQLLEMVLERLGRDVVPEVDQVAGEAARPDDVDLEDVDVGRHGGGQGQERKGTSLKSRHYYEK